MQAVSNQLRVLQVTPYFAPHVGGVETHVREVAERLIDLGIHAQVVTGDPSGELEPAEAVGRINVRRLPTYPRHKDWMLCPRLPRVIRSGDWDLVHVQSYHTLFAPIAMAAAARARIPYVVTFHSGGSSMPSRNRLRGTQMRTISPLLRRADRLVAVSDFEMSVYPSLIRGDPAGFVKISNGAGFPAGVEAMPSDGHLIVSLGRLERYKGHGRAILALPTVLEALPDARLWIAGDGPDRERLRSLADEIGVGDRVEIGATDRLTLAGRLMGASLVVLLSDFEAQGIAVLEAASLGLPALVANNSGMRELAERGFAKAVELDSSARDQGLAMLAAISAKPAADLHVPTWDECAESLAALYRAVLCRPDAG